jgi:hypothetical protein
VLNAPSGFALGWETLLIVGLPLGLGVWSALWWWRCDLRLEGHCINVGRLRGRRRQLTWEDIERFDIRPWSAGLLR